MKYAALTGWGKCLPPAVLTNDDLSTFLPTDDAWIVQRTGMKERRISHVCGLELSYVAAQRALACAGIEAADVDFIIYGSCSFDEHVPNTASGLQARLGANKAAAMDVNTACTSFLYGMSTATAFIQSGVAKNVLVIGVEHISKFMDWQNRNVSVLFGDGAAAAESERLGEMRRLCLHDTDRARIHDFRLRKQETRATCRLFGSGSSLRGSPDTSLAGFL
ncbi:MAG: hypothetical protein ACOVN2_01405 [Usitatibacteraceae bacterium]